MTLWAPQWLLLLVPLALLAWRAPRLALLRRPLRALCALVLILWFADPSIKTSDSGLDLWVLVDRSDSAAEALAASRGETGQILESGRGAEDRLFTVDFAESPVLREPGLAFEPSTASTALRLAVEFSLASLSERRRARLLVLTDGMSTEDLSDLGTLLRKAGVGLDLRLLSIPDGEDYRVGAIEAPLKVAAGQGFLLRVPIFGTSDGTVAYVVTRDGVRAGEGEVEIVAGRGTIRLAGSLLAEGATRYEVRLLPERDTRPGNNASAHWIEVAGEGSVLLISAYEQDPLAEVLRAAGLEVAVVTEPSSLHPGVLAGPRSVILNNVPAHQLPAEFLSALEFFVEHQGGGLLMAGGKNSFGSGGYFESPLDPLLPVSMELRQEHRKLAVAMALVMDRSGSMAAGAGGGSTKMDLANEGAARAVELLGPSDAVTVFAADTEPHLVVPLSRIGSDASKIGAQIRRVQSAGGGIYVFSALSAAWKELQKSDFGQRHVILFSDAADSEEPEGTQRLVDEMVSGGASLSVIALGSPQDKDARFLEELASRAQGRIYFNADASQVPGLFAQETISVARSAFLEEPVGILDAGGWLEIADTPVAWPAQVGGYNLSYAREGAGVAAIGNDEYRAPLVAFWQRGAGRVGAISFPVSGPFSELFQSWSGAPAFLQTLCRWLKPGPPPPGTSLRTKFSGSDLLVEFLFDTSLAATFAQTPPRLGIALGASGAAREIPWEKIAADRFSARVPVPPGTWVRGVVDLAETRITFGPSAPGTDPEWRNDPTALRTLREAVAASGGRELTDLRETWRGGGEPETQPLGNLLLWLLLGLFLAEVAVTRWIGTLSLSGRRRRP